MGLGLRIFLVNDDDSLKRLSAAKYERLRRREPGESLPQYAGKRVRYVLVVVEMENRRPEDIIMTEHSYLYFDSEGRIETAERQRASVMVVNMVPPSPKERHIKGVIDAHQRFARKRYKRRYSWTPTPQIVESIVTAIFGKESPMG